MRTVLLTAVMAASTTLSFAQPPMTPQADVPTPVVRGWVFTPSLAYGLSWDDNILIQGRGEDTRWDVMNAVSPRGALDYRDKRTLFSAAYDGTILLYGRIRDLNAYDQRGNLSARRMLTSRLTLVSDGNVAVSPTTELTEIVGVPFVRTGARVAGARGGIEAVLSKAATLTAATCVASSGWVAVIGGTRALPRASVKGRDAAMAAWRERSAATFSAKSATDIAPMSPASRSRTPTESFSISLSPMTSM